tara:strand:+ start:367 stop:534 length:168 start_codon:yes stop_codon:yes gene_type:complete
MKDKKYCSNCRTKYTIIYNEDETEMEPLSCPFCSYEVDETDNVEEVESEEEDSWN